MTQATSDQGPVRPAVMTIAGSDSCGGAGVQADLKTFSALDVFGTSAITCITAQNPNRLSGVMPVPVSMVEDQIKTVCESYPISVA